MDQIDDMFENSRPVEENQEQMEAFSTLLAELKEAGRTFKPVFGK